MMSGLAKRLQCDASNITGIVDRLEARQLIERVVVPDDRRAKLLQITEVGSAIIESMLESSQPGSVFFNVSRR